jgi:pimeloyl-ACP methyl ester carboxylesterase
MTDIAHLRFSRQAVKGVTLHVAEAGPANGPVTFLLHGFPEFWFGWRQQVAALAAAGLRVVVPDLRGYNKSDKPQSVTAYDLDRLAEDVTGLADALGAVTFDIVGHDWGGSVGWWVASRWPARVRRFAALNAPHPAVWKNAMRNDPAQRRLSRYVSAFRLPWLPELLLRSGNFKGLADALRQAKRADAFSAADLAQYRAAWAMPGALSGMINYYRALLAKDMPLDAMPRVPVPTRIIWGKRDKFGLPSLAEASLRLCDHGELVYLDDATHWVQHDEPARVNELLGEFLR